MTKADRNWFAARVLNPNPPEPRIYRIIRFRFEGKPRTLRQGLTLTEARAHCEREDTSSHSTGPGAWFDGYDYMRGCRPREGEASE